MSSYSQLKLGSFMSLWKIATVALFASNTLADCTTFDVTTGLLSGAPNDESYTTSSIRSYIVSAVVECTSANAGQPITGNGVQCNSSRCSLEVPQNLLVNIESQLNITVSDDQKRQILALAKESSSQLRGQPLYDFNSTMSVSLNGVQTCIELGTTAFWSYTPTLRCVEGVLSDCSGDDSPANGTAIRACGANYFAVNSRGLGSTTNGPNIALAPGSNATDGPTNATLIDNSDVSTGAASTTTSMGTAAVAVMVAAILFAIL